MKNSFYKRGYLELVANIALISLLMTFNLTPQAFAPRPYPVTVSWSMTFYSSIHGGR